MAASEVTSPPGSRGHQAARVDGIDGDVGAIGGVGGGAQLRAVLFAGLRDAAGEFDHRFASGNHAEHVGQAFDGFELLVGIEDVEFGFVGGVRGAGVLLHVVLAVLRRGVQRIGELRRNAGKKLRDGFVELVVVVGESRRAREDWN